MEKLYRELYEKIDGNDLMRRIKELNRIDLGQTFRHYHMS